jgi:hypothetical protein
MPLLETRASASALGYGLNASLSTDLILYLDAGNSASYPGSGTTWNDLSPLARPLSFYTTPSYSSSNGGFINFQGNPNKNYAENTSHPAYNVDDVTVEIWTKLNNSTSQSGFWIEKGIVNTQYAAFMEGTGLRWRLSGADSLISPEELTANYLSINTWYQLVFTHTPGQQKMYRNASLLFTKSASTSLAKLDAHGFTVGAWYNGNGATVENHGYFIDAGISIIRVYNKVLTPTEISTNFNQFRSRYSI